MSKAAIHYSFDHEHLLGIDGLHPLDLTHILDLANDYAEATRSGKRADPVLSGKTVVNLFFENSTRTMSSFEIAARRLGADVVSMPVAQSSVKKGETLIDTAMTLNAMKPDVLVVRHSASGGAKLLSRKVDCAVINAGDGTHEHPTQGLLDTLTIRRNKGRVEGLKVVICGDIVHSRVARSTTLALHLLGAEVHLCAPRTLMPSGTETWGAASATSDFDAALEGADVVMMLRLQLERMDGAYLPSRREYFRYFGLTAERLALAREDAIVMHPGPMNRGIEIESAIADGERSVITEQVEMGVAVREAVLHLLAGGRS
ncbi:MULTISPECIES: aspartate carbamoyltransferase catalytic subunit [Hyphomonas]|uniref:Aspartate carbamoyltransferase n=1 Tax=Hyphomonas atlantica TaxID=1280948 RepID=A0A059E0L2_9PROT|nr:MULTISPECIES: aspartate carbamoyltransferase catalytic subunit [Hyphomonas]KCZ60443.1 aspartate carbamoyltransferase [Hyphomonas atlantica]MAM07194.1 aspartate carbamoyltransferase catalytic subunit [Hyphomonas sp.]HAE93205.1 aspartate carbamoyltransferase catalytic subunit [Hyphomonas atlantica]HBH43162.1 aspartate carbamoyltransferase catalytic subunit [Hyphomonas atlantica]HBQ49222.1 aspartate carbamoyltransferase catalytic subunit [Hyphomonas atlantica]|tara:strand:+ start:4005 stop:4952 length:948 start_codon:yes stop_codon:yes gene_type:complete